MKHVKKPQARFGSKEFFTQYTTNQIEKETGNSQQVIYRVHFAMSDFILETHKGKDALVMLQNLNEALETMSKALRS